MYDPEHVGDQEDEEDSTEADTGAAAVAPAVISVVTATAAK